eukprot:6212766-Pleurochrysis_carterae.AAC.3
MVSILRPTHERILTVALAIVDREHTSRVASLGAIPHYLREGYAPCASTARRPSTDHWLLPWLCNASMGLALSSRSQEEQSYRYDKNASQRVNHATQTAPSPVM